MKNRTFSVIGLLLIILAILIGCFVDNRTNNVKSSSVKTQLNESKEYKRKKKNNMDQRLNIKVNNHTYTADFANNRSAKAFIEKLNQGPVVVHAHDFENFEKVGDLPWSLPRTDQQITTKAGDVILYQGKYMVLYYKPNSWNFTRIARIKNVSSHEIHKVLGNGDVTITYSLEDN